MRLSLKFMRFFSFLYSVVYGFFKIYFFKANSFDLKDVLIYDSVLKATKKHK